MGQSKLKEVEIVILSYLRTIILYGLLILTIRLMGKRQIGQMEPTEFVVTMMVANLATIPMENTGIPLIYGIVPILTVLGMELVLAALSLRSIGVRRLLCGKPVILIENGRIIQENLRKTRVNMDELTGHLRQKDVLDLRSVQFAILETNGNLSVFPYPGDRPPSAKEPGIQAKRQYLPVTVISDGVLLEKNLEKTGKDRAWVNRVLAEQQTDIAGTWLLSVNDADQIVFVRKEDT